MPFTNFELVCQFNQTFDFPIYKPELTPLETQYASCKYRCDLIKEEAVEEFGKAFHENNYVEMLDAVIDSLYVLYGACYTFGINPDSHIYINKQIQSVDINSDFSEKPTKVLFDFFDEERSIEESYMSNIVYEQMLRKSMLENKNIFEVYTILMCLIINTYNIGFHLTETAEQLDGAFLNVHQSNMSKLCSSVAEAEATVKSYEEKFVNGSSPYDSPYYYEIQPNSSLYVVKNKSTGKALKSINYTPASLSKFLKKCFN